MEQWFIRIEFLQSPEQTSQERQLLGWSLFQFEAKDVEVITTTKPIDFFPA